LTTFFNRLHNKHASLQADQMPSDATYALEQAFIVVKYTQRHVSFLSSVQRQEGSASQFNGNVLEFYNRYAPRDQICRKLTGGGELHMPKKHDSILTYQQFKQRESGIFAEERESGSPSMMARRNGAAANALPPEQLLPPAAEIADAHANAAQKSTRTCIVS
jgi:hypothetical protein